MFDRDALQQNLDFRTLAEVFYLNALDQLSAANLNEPSLCPGWTRKHVAVHMIHNAEGLMRLLTWARTGVETRMYPSREARDQAITDDVAHLPNTDVLHMSHEVASEFADALTELNDSHWQATIINGRGRRTHAFTLPWMRAREAFVHAVDLNIGTTALDYPAAVTDLLLEQVPAVWEEAHETANFVIHITDRPDKENWHLTVGAPPAEPVEVTGKAGQVLQYLMGRGFPTGPVTQKDSELLTRPEPPRWL